MVKYTFNSTGLAEVRCKSTGKTIIKGKLGVDFMIGFNNELILLNNKK